MSSTPLMSINHIVVLMLENRSFDHMLGFLYKDRNNVSLAGQPFEGLAPNGATPLDHTSILKTVEQRWGLPSLTARDAAAVDVGDALTLAAPRTDDPLAGVVVPTPGINPSAALPSHLQRMYADQLSQVGVADREFE